MKSTPLIKNPTLYKGCIIAPAPVRNGGFDVFETNGRWFYVKTQKQAKWWAAIHARLEESLNANPFKPAPIPVDDHTPRKK
jgi:hypothetical protein